MDVVETNKQNFPPVWRKTRQQPTSTSYVILTEKKGAA